MTSAYSYEHSGRVVIRDRDSEREIWLHPRHAIYAPDCIQHFDYYHGAVQPTHSTVVDYSQGRFHQVVGFDDFPIFAPSLMEPFDTCRQYLELARLTGGEFVMDLGAYCGLTSIAFAKAVGLSGFVLAVEPDPVSAATAEINLGEYRRVSKLRNVRLMDCAVAGTAAIRPFVSEGNMGSGFTGTLHASRHATARVAAYTLDHLMATTGLARVDFVKMDIEGAELEVLRAAGGFLERFRPRLIVEPHFVEGRLVTDDVCDLLSGYGYEVDVIQQRGVAIPLITAEPGRHHD